MKSKTLPTELFAKEMQAFQTALQTGGVRSALAYLNQRTPHRYTGIYQYDGQILRNLYLYDKFNPVLEKGEDTPLSETFCSLLVKQQALELADATLDARVKGQIKTAVTSYCGVLIRDAANQPFGSLCHFDTKSCQERITDLPLLEMAAGILYRHLEANPPAAGQ